MTTQISNVISVDFDDDEPEDCTIVYNGNFKITMTEKDAILVANTILNQYYGK